jgi:D-alanine-D-alanine ligase
MPRPLIAVMLGGPSDEHDVSLSSGTRILSELDRDRYDPAPIFVDRRAVWHFGQRPWDSAEPGWRPQVDAGVAWEPGTARGMPWRPDVVFIGLHGTYGEDGQVQTLLEREGLRYTGSGPEASRLAMNKVVAKERFARAGLALARGWEVPLSESAEHAAARIQAEHAGPLVVKPRDGGSSVGVRMIEGETDLAAAIVQGQGEGTPLLIEERIAGTEITVGVLEELADRRPQALPVTEIVPPADSFFDYVAKYTPGVSLEVTPARIDEAHAAKAQSMALAAHRVLGCYSYSRSDFMLSPQRGPVLIELNTLPGVTPTSLFPQEAAAVGIDYRQMLTRIVELALRRPAPATP